MSRDLTILISMKRLLYYIGSGLGIAGAIVKSFRLSGVELASAARLTLLGFPPEISMNRFLNEEGKEISMLASLIVKGRKGDSVLLGKRGEGLSVNLERWIEARESKRLEERVLRFRGLVISSVLGALLAMISTLGPMLETLAGAPGTTRPDPMVLEVVSGSMVFLSSTMLGLYLSGRGFLLNTSISLAVFLGVRSAVSPLGGFFVPITWAIK